MAKQFRKPKKRPSRERQNVLDEEKRDADLEELWEVVLSESSGRDSWSVPWRSGVNVAELCLLINRELFQFHKMKAAPRSTPEADDVPAIEQVRLYIDSKTRYLSQETYWKIQEHIEAINARAHHPHQKFLLVALRAIQLSIANSDGGGRVYNSLLEAIWRYAPPDVNKYVRMVRCKDALGVSWSFDSSADDRRRRAFYTAWDRGLYQVAYALGGPQ